MKLYEYKNISKMNMKTNYIMYCRKSSESEDRQMASIPSQVEVLKQLAFERNIKISKNFSESKSAKAPGRKEFDRMLDYIDKRNDIKGIFSWQLNRLSRNPIDTAKIQWLLQLGKIDEIVTPNKTYTENDSDLTMGVEGAMANRFIRELRANTKRGIDAKISKGLAPILAPPGYQNDMYKRQGEKSISPHPIYFSLMRKIFELALTGTFSMGDLHKEAVKMGIKSHRGCVISKSQFLFLLRNPFYAGKFIFRGQLYQGVHKPILTEGEFNALQDVLAGKSKPRKQIHDFPLTGLINCSCGYKITAENHKKKNGLTYDYYKCSQKGKGCLEPMVSAKELEKQVYEFLGKIQLSEKFVEWAGKWLREAESQDREVRHDSFESLKKQHKEVVQKIEFLYDAWLNSKIKKDGMMDDEEYGKRKQALLAERESVHTRMNNVEKDWDAWTELSIKTMNFASTAQERWLHGTVLDKKAIMTVIGSNLVLKDKKLTIEPLTPFLMIENAWSTRSNSYDEANLGSPSFLQTVLGGQRDSNSQLSAPQADTLTIELWPPCHGKKQKFLSNYFPIRLFVGSSSNLPTNIWYSF